MSTRRVRSHAAARSVMPEINLKQGMPRVEEALATLENALARARSSTNQHGLVSLHESERVPISAAIKFIHGYGSSGQGGEIRLAVQKRLRALEAAGTIRACIFGEDWSTSNAHTWELLKMHPAWKNDAHLGKKNLGITIVVL